MSANEIDKICEQILNPDCPDPVRKMARGQISPPFKGLSGSSCPDPGQWKPKGLIWRTISVYRTNDELWLHKARFDAYVFENAAKLHRFWMHPSQRRTPSQRRWLLYLYGSSTFVKSGSSKRGQQFGNANWYQCWLCRLNAGDQWHHMIPISQGGLDDPVNILPLCHLCHGDIHSYGREQDCDSPIRAVGSAVAYGVR